MLKEYKSFPLVECKSEDGGRFTGYAAAYSKDFYGDRIAPGAFAQSIKDQRGRIPIFFNHDSDHLVGFSTDLAEDAKGLYIDAVLSLDSTKGADAYAVLKTAAKVDYRMGLSIGFVAQEWEMEDDTRILKTIDLWETSLTPFPANRMARVESLKSLRDVEQILRDVGGCSGTSAKRALACLRSYLSTDVDGNQPPTARDARLLRQDPMRECADAFRAAFGG